MAECYDCGLDYDNSGFADLVVPHDIWALISPTGDESGLLCPTCMVRAAARAGLTHIQAIFRSGPFTAAGIRQSESTTAGVNMSDPYDKARRLIDGDKPGERLTGPPLIRALTDEIERLTKNEQATLKTIETIQTIRMADEAEIKRMSDRIEELEAFLVAEGDLHYSHREFEKMESERDSWRDVAASVTADVKMLYDAAKDFHVNHRSEIFGDSTCDELERILDAVSAIDYDK